MKSKKTATTKCKTACQKYTYSSCFTPKTTFKIANKDKYTYICNSNRLYMAVENDGIGTWNLCEEGDTCVCYNTVESVGDELPLFCPTK